jgi:hypothetical protein
MRSPAEMSLLSTSSAKGHGCHALGPSHPMKAFAWRVKLVLPSAMKMASGRTTISVARTK